MQLRHLELFVVVAEEGQFTRAARRCHVSQSALSTAIRALEKDLGAELFLRTTRQVRLTDAGHALLGEARRTLASVETARAAVERVGAEMRGSLAVGGIPTRNIYNQSGALAAFRRTHPAVEISYVRSTTHALVEGVLSGSLDVAFVSLPDRMPKGLDVTPLASRKLEFVCRPDHPLADKGPIPVSALVDEEFVANPPGTLGYEIIERLVAPTRGRLHAPFRVDYVPTMLDFVANGLGVTLLHGGSARGHPGVVSVDITPAVGWELGLIRPKPDLLSPVAKAFVESIPRLDPVAPG